MNASVFPRISELIKPTKAGRAEIDHYTVTKSDVFLEIVRGGPSEEETIAVLRIDGVTMMSDNLHERLTNLEVLEKARGDVLIAGLGLGMIIHPILKKDSVNSVTVIEKEHDVITLIHPTLPQSKKLHIICSDIFTWKPIENTRYDCIYFDIWANASGGIATPEQTELETRFMKYKTSNGWMGSWHPFDTNIALPSDEDVCELPTIDDLWLTSRYQQIGNHKQAEIMYNYILEKNQKFLQLTN